MKQFFDSMFWRGMAVIGLLYLLAFLAYGGWAGLPILAIVAVSAAVLSFQRLDRGIMLAFLELFSNPHGALVTSDLGGFAVSLRMAIFVGVVAGWGIGVLRRRYRFNRHDVRFHPFVPLALAIALGFILGGLSDDPSAAFADGNAYLYLLYALPILSIDWTRERQHELLQLLAAGAAWVAGLSLALLYVFSHFGEDVLRVTYTFFRDVRVAEITMLTGGMYRVFIQSQAFVAIAGFMLLAFGAQKGRRIPMALCGVVVWAVLIISLSRSFWIATVPAGIAVIAMRHNDARLHLCRRARSIATLFCVAAAGAALLFIIVIFPIPAQRIGGGALLESLRDRAVEDQDVAVASRWNLLRPMSSAIMRSPLVGHGFGKTVTFQTDDPRVRAIRPDGTWTTYAMEWGWLELWVKMGILGPVAFLYAGYMFTRALFKRNRQADGWLCAGLIGGLVFLFVTHFFSPYLNHPIGLGYLLFLVPFLPTKNSQAVAVAAYVRTAPLMSPYPARNAVADMSGRPSG